MPSFNSIHIMGNVTQEPSLSYTPNQFAVCDFSIAQNQMFMDRSGTVKEDTCFVDVRAFGKLAENVQKYVNKGQLVFVDGRLSYETWETKDKPPVKRSKHRVIARGVQFLSLGVSAEEGGEEGRERGQEG